MEKDKPEEKEKPRIDASGGVFWPLSRALEDIQLHRKQSAIVFTVYDRQDGRTYEVIVHEHVDQRCTCMPYKTFITHCERRPPCKHILFLQEEKDIIHGLMQSREELRKINSQDATKCPR